MDSRFTLAALPLLWLLHRAGLLARRPARLAAVALAVGVVLAGLPWQGVDYELLKRANIFVTAAVCVWLLLQSLGVRLLDRRREVLALGFAALGSLVLYLDFFSFHGLRTWVHYHDVVHYHLGAKYFPELGYGNLYTAMLRAEMDTYGTLRSPEARDLTGSGEVVPSVVLLGRSDAVKARFSAQRWQAFREDVGLYRSALGSHWGTVLKDHGFNPTPVWALGGGAIASLVPAGSRQGVLLLALFDPVLLLVGFGAVWRVFGARTTLLAVIHFCVVFGASFGWTGGAFLRYVWFTCLLLALCAWQRGSPLAAGALIGLAASLRVFPVAFLAGPVLQGLYVLVRRRRLDGEVVRCVSGFVMSAGVLVLASGLLPGHGFGAWAGFRKNIGEHVQMPAPNLVGSAGVIAYYQGPRDVDEVEAARLFAERARARRLQVTVALPLALLACLLAAPALDRVTATVLTGLALCVTGLNLASYYWVMVVALTVALRDRPRRLIAIFGLELFSHALLLFEPTESLQYADRSLMILLLLAALLLDPLREGLRLWREPVAAPAAPA